MNRTARGIDRCGSCDSSPIDAAASKPTKSRIPSSTPPSTPPPVTPNQDVSLGLKTESEIPLSPPFARITIARISIGTNDSAAKVSIARTATRTPRWFRTSTIASPISPNTHQAGRVVGDVRLPGPLGEQPDAEVDAAAAEKERAEEEDAGREDAHPGMRAVGQVLVDRARAGEAAGVERDGVADREDAEARDQDRERGVPGRARCGVRDEAEDQRGREHRPDRERLGNSMDRREVLLPEARARGRRAGFAH